MTLITSNLELPYFKIRFLIKGDIANLQLYGIVANKICVIVATLIPLSESINEKLEQIPIRTNPLNRELKKIKDMIANFSLKMPSVT